MGSGFKFALVVIIAFIAYGVYEIRRTRQIAEAMCLSDQILVMARGRLWAKYLGARFDIFISPTFDMRKFSASLVMYTLDSTVIDDSEGAWVSLLKTRSGCSDALEALEELYEGLAIYVIEHEDEIKQAVHEAISPKVRRADDLDSMIPPRKAPYIDRLGGRVITRCAAMQATMCGSLDGCVLGSG